MLFSAIISFTVSVTKAIVTLGLAAEGLTAIGNALTAIGKALGLIRPETQVEDLGDQALQAEEAGITPDAFDAYEDYVKAVESFQLDPEKSKQFTPAEKEKNQSKLANGESILTEMIKAAKPGTDAAAARQLLYNIE